MALPDQVTAYNSPIVLLPDQGVSNVCNSLREIVLKSSDEKLTFFILLKKTKKKHVDMQILTDSA